MIEESAAERRTKNHHQYNFETEMDRAARSHNAVAFPGASNTPK